MDMDPVEWIEAAFDERVASTEMPINPTRYQEAVRDYPFRLIYNHQLGTGGMFSFKKDHEMATAKDICEVCCSGDLVVIGENDVRK